MSTLTAYRRLYQLAGLPYLVIAFIGRLPMSMAQLGTLLLVADATGSYGAGGLAAGSLAVANAVCSPLAGALADRIGQRPVVLVQSLLGAGALGALVALAQASVPTGVLVAAAAFTGACLPQVGPLARVRWRPITASAGPADQRRLVDAAFSYEGATDEASFAIGPAFVGLGAVLLSPGGALIVAAVLLAVFGSAFALHPTARARSGSLAPLPTGVLVTVTFVVLALAQLMIGMLFGSVQTGSTVLATEDGQPGLAGLVHATLAVGSAVAGLATAFLPASFGQERRVLIASWFLFALSTPLLLVGSLLPLVLVMLVLGCAVAPYMIGVFALAERIVPPARSGAAMTVLASTTGLGYALGSSIAGRLADHHGATAAFAVTVSATFLAAALATTQQRRLRGALAQAADAESELVGVPAV